MRQTINALRTPITVINDQGKEEVIYIGTVFQPIGSTEPKRPEYFYQILFWLFVAATSVWAALVVATFFSTSRFMEVFIAFLLLRWGLSALLSIPFVKKFRSFCL